MYFTSAAIYYENFTFTIHDSSINICIPHDYLCNLQTFKEAPRTRLSQIERSSKNLHGSRACGNDIMIIKSIILGIVQGLTEFLPISSSGHLAILEKYFGITEPVVLATFLHFGTFVATVVFFFKPIIAIINGLVKGEKESVDYVIYIIVGTIPIVLFAVIFRTQIEQCFTDIPIVGIFLGITGLILLLTSIVKRGDRKVKLLSAIMIGVSQMFAVFPGISRSGMTISTGLFSKVSPEESFKFSFLLSLPAILGANLLKLRTISQINDFPSIIIGMFCSFIFGLIALKILKGIIHRRFHLFGIYCLAISIIILLLK